MIASPPSGTPKANASDQLNPSGALAATVLSSARQSAGLSHEQLAAHLGSDAAIIRSWEDGSEPLANVPVTVVDHLRSALLTAGAEPALVADLDAAMWCDLVIDAAAAGEDASCLLADPLAAEPGFAELLGWALAGRAPARHQPYASGEPLVEASVAASVISAVFHAMTRCSVLP
jgi:hypothetical protein